MAIDHKGMSQTLLVTPQIVRENTTIDDNNDEKKLAVVIRQVEDDYIRNIIGPNLYFTLLDKVNTNSLSGDYLTLINHYVVPTILRWVEHDWQIKGSFQNRSQGIGQQSTPNYVPVALADIEKLLESHYSPKAKDASNVMIRYLKANSDKFPEYYNWVNLEDTIPDTELKSSGILLTGRRNKNCNNYNNSIDLNW